MFKYSFQIITTLIIVSTTMASCSKADHFVSSLETKDCNCSSYDSLFPQVPGTVVDYVARSEGKYIGSPSIEILPDGTYLAAHDFFGPNSGEFTTGITKIFQSIDNGNSWHELSAITGQYWSQLFYHDSKLYILGTEKAVGEVVIRSSVDGGATWSTPIDGTRGRLITGGRYHCAPTPVIKANGRLWRGMEDVMGGGSVWGQPFRTFMMSIADTADLLDAANWTISNRLGYNPDYMNGDFGGWLEGNAVQAPNGEVVNLLRTHYMKNGDEFLSMTHASTSGTALTFIPDSGFIPFPGGCKKFVIRKEDNQPTYWSLSNYVPDQYKGHNTERTHNTLALLKSTDLLHWEIQGIVLHHPDIAKAGFQYADFQFDGNDLVFVSRTSYDDGAEGPDSQHNANFLTFHRVENYASYRTPPQWTYLLPNN